MRQCLATVRLILRDVTVEDAALLFDLDSNPEVMRYIGRRLALDENWYRERIRTVYLQWQTHSWRGLWIVLDRQSQAFLGWTFIRPAVDSMDARELGWNRPGDDEIGFRYRRSAWGKGIATEAAMVLVQAALSDPVTTAVVACANAANAASLRVLQKLGLERVGEVHLPDTSEPIVKLARML